MFFVAEEEEEELELALGEEELALVLDAPTAGPGPGSMLLLAPSAEADAGGKREFSGDVGTVGTAGTPRAEAAAEAAAGTAAGTTTPPTNPSEPSVGLAEQVWIRPWHISALSWTRLCSWSSPPSWARLAEEDIWDSERRAACWYMYLISKKDKPFHKLQISTRW